MAAKKKSPSIVGRYYARDRRAYHVIYLVPGGFAFVRIALGTWLRVPACVAFVACPACGAAVGEPCKGRNDQPRTGRHYLRPRAMRDAIKNGKLDVDRSLVLGGPVVRVPT